MGYAIELFEDSTVKEEFLCSICQDVVQDPMLVDPCEHAFCGQCIGPWSKRSGTCPDCREPIEALKPPPRIYMRWLNGLRVRCSFKVEGGVGVGGCPEVMTLGELESHKKRCEFNPDREIQCGGGCGAAVVQAQLAQHKCVPHLLEVVKQMQAAADKQADELAAKDKVIKELEATNDKVTKELQEAKEELKTVKDELFKCQQQEQATIGGNGQQQTTTASVSSHSQISRPDIVCTFATNIRAHTREEIVDAIFDQINRAGSFPTSAGDLQLLKCNLQYVLDQKVSAGSTLHRWRVYVGPIYSIAAGTPPEGECMVTFRVKRLGISVWQSECLTPQCNR